MSARKYELIVVFAPTLSEPQLNEEIEKTKKLLTTNGAQDVHVDIWGKRELAYTLKKQSYGQYVVFYFESANSTTNEEVASLLRIDETVLKFQTHRISEHVRRFKGRTGGSSGDKAAA